MNEEELIETLRLFEKKRVEQLDDNAQNVFYAIMKIADERDELKSRIDKAIELLKNYGNGTFDSELLKILKGDNNG